MKQHPILLGNTPFHSPDQEIDWALVELDGQRCRVQLVGHRLEIEPTELVPPTGARGKLALIQRA